MENAIIAQNIKRYFKAGDGTTVHALDGVSMEIKKGTLAILKGRSGSGKTTLLNILSALDMPTEGSVQFLDKNLEQMTEKDREMLRRYEMGFVFQSIALIPTMTAYENVEFALRLAKNKRQIRKNLTDMDNDIGDAKIMCQMKTRRSGYQSCLIVSDSQSAWIICRISYREVSSRELQSRALWHITRRWSLQMSRQEHSIPLRDLKSCDCSVS